MFQKLTYIYINIQPLAFAFFPCSKFHFQGNALNILIGKIHQVEGSHHKTYATWEDNIFANAKDIKRHEHVQSRCPTPNNPCMIYLPHLPLKKKHMWAIYFAWMRLALFCFHKEFKLSR